MGWMFQKGQTRTRLVARRTKNWDGKLPNGKVAEHRCLRHCYRGNRFSGVLWTVWERTIHDGHEVFVTARWIGCDLLRYQNGYGWGYKDIEESMHPYYYSCPLSYLDMVPAACKEWRQGVREYHADRKRRGKAEAIYDWANRHGVNLRTERKRLMAADLLLVAVLNDWSLEVAQIRLENTDGA